MRTTWAAPALSFSVKLRPRRTGIWNTLIIKNAYWLRDPRTLVGYPQWAQNERFDIDAKVDASDAKTFSSLSPQEKYQMPQEVLTERFGLKAHTGRGNFLDMP